MAVCSMITVKQYSEAPEGLIDGACADRRTDLHPKPACLVPYLSSPAPQSYNKI